jgi:hypothetical protein
MKLKCFFGHKWKQIGKAAYIQEDDLTPPVLMAGCECKRCRDKELRNAFTFGRFLTMTARDYWDDVYHTLWYPKEVKP